MSFYVFKLDEISVVTPRDKARDTDVIVFGVLVNQLDRAHGTGTFTLMQAGTKVRAGAVPARNRKNMDAAWAAGPFELAPGDLVHVVCTGTNVGDDEKITLDTELQDKIELKILGAIVGAAVGAIPGLVGSVIGGALGLIGDPVGTLLGFEPPVRCNGPVFSDAAEFSSEGLDSLTMAILPPPTTISPRAPGILFTRNTSEPGAHQQGCGDPARTDLTLAVFRVPVVSVRALLASRFPEAGAVGGIRRLAPAGAGISLKSLLGIRP